MKPTNILFKSAAAFALAFAVSGAQAVLITPDNEDAGPPKTWVFTNGDFSEATITDVTATEMIVNKTFAGTSELAMTGTVSGTGSFTVSESIQNLYFIDPAEPFLDYHVGLTFFDTSTAGGAGTMSITSASSSAFTTATITGNQIDFSGGSVAFLDTFDVSFGIDVVEDAADIRWTITQYPTFTGGGPDPIPEPTTLALLGLGLAGMGAVRRRKV